MEAVTESERKEWITVSKRQNSARVWRISGLTRYEIAEPVSRETSFLMRE